MLRNDNDREIFYLPLFVENRFHFGRLSIVPGVRIENIWQGVKENLNVDKTAAGTPLADEDIHEFVPLFGLGLAYEIAHKTELYAKRLAILSPEDFHPGGPDRRHCRGPGRSGGEQGCPI